MITPKLSSMHEFTWDVVYFLNFWMDVWFLEHYPAYRVWNMWIICPVGKYITCRGPEVICPSHIGFIITVSQHLTLLVVGYGIIVWDMIVFSLCTTGWAAFTRFWMVYLIFSVHLKTKRILTVYWSFAEKTSVKQSMELKVCSNFQMSFLHLS